MKKSPNEFILWLNSSRSLIFWWKNMVQNKDHEGWRCIRDDWRPRKGQMFPLPSDFYFNLDEKLKKTCHDG